MKYFFYSISKDFNPQDKIDKNRPNMIAQAAINEKFLSFCPYYYEIPVLYVSLLEFRMTVLKKFHYPDILQRRLIFINAFVTFLLIGWYAADCLLSFSQIFPYSPILEFLLTGFIAALLVGNLAAKPLFGLLPISRIGYIITELVFIAACAAFAERNLILKGDNSFITLYNISPLLCVGAVCLIPFLAGLKNRYFLKVSCGIFFDEKKINFNQRTPVFKRYWYACRSDSDS